MASYQLTPTVPPGSDKSAGVTWPKAIPESGGGRRAQFQALLNRLVARRGTQGALVWPSISRAEAAAIAATALRVIEKEAPSSGAAGALNDALNAQLGWTGHIASPWRLDSAATEWAVAQSHLWGAIAAAIADVPPRPAAVLPIEEVSSRNLRAWAKRQLGKLRRELGKKLPKPVLPVIPKPKNPFAGWGAALAIAAVVILTGRK